MLSLHSCKIDLFGTNDVSQAHWAVLVAGSNGFWNYRHQSDVFHSYQILLENGMPKENIIVLAYDDIANNKENPFPGKVFNQPDPSGPGRNVYKGVSIDYTGDDVNPENFLAILEGDEAKVSGKGSGRVLKSTQSDNVFVYFSDHGATGLIAFPNSELYADKLIATFKKMKANNSYNKLVFYLEACESGSMFDKILPTDMNIYTTTAANPDQSSWASYCYPDDIINNIHVGSCLGDEYSVNWMEDSEGESSQSESLDTQFKNTKSKTKNSEVHQYGSLDYVSESIWDFQGENVEKRGIVGGIGKYFTSVSEKIKSYLGLEPQQTRASPIDAEFLEYLEEAKGSRVDSREAKLFYLYQKAMRTNDQQSQKQLDQEIEHVNLSDYIFSSFNEELSVSEMMLLQIFSSIA